MSGKKFVWIAFIILLQVIFFGRSVVFDVLDGS